MTRIHPAVEDLRKAFAKMRSRPQPTVRVDKPRPFVFVGAGHLAREMATRLARYGLLPVACCDNNPSLHGSTVNGCPVEPVAMAAAAHGLDADFIVTVYSAGPRYETLSRQLKDLGVGSVMHYVEFMEDHADACLPYYAYDRPHRLAASPERAEEAFLLLADDESRRIFLGSIRFRGLGDLNALQDECSDYQYFPDGVYGTDGQEVLVDCGAYDGDTLRSFVLRRSSAAISRYFGFEPDSATFARLRQSSLLMGIEPYRLHLLQAATASYSGTIRFNADGTTAAAIAADGSSEVACVSLDEQLASETPTFIKLDVEGAEADSLIGAKNIIAIHNPLIAVCVYHKPHDLWDLLLLIRDLNPSYTFFLRNHGSGGFEIVLYAVPKHRLVELS